MSNHSAPNRLAKETSPYLLQHKNNPVDWYPWGAEALDRSVEENKPILLSIGYSACHWCHVMEHESFENAEIAEIMNKLFVCIKVDREERPDLDHIYQNVAQALTKGGGWPLTVFLTPARKPFYGGTYFPPEDRYGRPGFKRVLANIAKAYQTDPMGVAQNAMKLSAYISGAEGVSSAASGEKNSPTWDSISNAAELLLGNIDFENGGIGGAPKFPNPMAFSFLWRAGVLKNNEKLREAVLLTLRKMAHGGIYDQLGGGFSRYSVDATWSVPHFEKMLYDNALLLKLYSEVLLSTHLGDADRKLFTTVVRETVDYLLREMVSPDGGFYAAQDADSEGEEGKFFAWDLTDLKSALRDETDVRIFSLRYGVDEAGNFELGKTVLYVAQSIGAVAHELSLTEKAVDESLERSRKTLFKLRDKRVHPGTDNTVLSSWNGLAISGFSWASQALKKAGFAAESQRAIDAASRAFHLIREEVTSGQDGRLFSTFQAGEGKYNAYLDDYAFMAMGALDLARFEKSDAVVAQAVQMATLWMKRVIRRFKDKTGAGYFFTSDDHEELIHRPKTIFDQAIPSGTAVIIQTMMALTEINPDTATEFAEEWEKQLSAFWAQAERQPYGCGEMLNAALLSLVGPLVISGDGAFEACNSPFVFRKGISKAQAKTDAGRLLVCHRQTCDAPLASLGALEQAIETKIFAQL
jgi:uncharacterized protein YyaL (SSP411 family)